MKDSAKTEARGAAQAVITAVIVDDEQLARSELAYLLKAHADVRVVAEGRSGHEALQLIREHEPDVVFLDINMPGQNGMEVVHKLLERRGKHKLPQVIFATAYDQYAVQAFEINAVDYLLKPVEKARLALALQRVRRHMDASANPAEKLEAALESVRKTLAALPHGAGQSAGHLAAPASAPGTGTKPAAQSKLLVRAGNRMLLVDSRDLIFAAIQDSRLMLVTKECEGESSFKTIDELHASLRSALFWRAHRSYLVNIDHIKEVIPWFKSTFQLRMNDRKSTAIPVSRSQTKRLRELFSL